MYVLVLMVFTFAGVAVDHVPGYTEKACYDAAEQFEVGAAPSIAKHRAAYSGRGVTRIGFCIRGPDPHQ